MSTFQPPSVPQYVLPGAVKGLHVRGNIDLLSRPRVRNADGSFSTVRSVSFTTTDGRAILLPTVVGNRVVSSQEALAHYKKTGQHLGVFVNNAAADAYAEALHRQQALIYG